VDDDKEIKTAQKAATPISHVEDIILRLAQKW